MLTPCWQRIHTRVNYRRKNQYFSTPILFSDCVPENKLQIFDGKKKEKKIKEVKVMKNRQLVRRFMTHAVMWLGALGHYRRPWKSRVNRFNCFPTLWIVWQIKRWYLYPKFICPCHAMPITLDSIVLYSEAKDMFMRIMSLGDVFGPFCQFLI